MGSDISPALAGPRRRYVLLANAGDHCSGPPPPEGLGPHSLRIRMRSSEDPERRLH